MYSYKNQYPIESLPHRIRQDNGNTVTDIKSLDNESLLELGFVQVDNPPEYSKDNHKLEWSGTEWQLEELTAQEVLNRKSELSEMARGERDVRFDNDIWRVERYQSEIRLGLTPTEDIVKLDNYFQSLRDITKQETFPYNIDWPDESFLNLIDEFDAPDIPDVPDAGDPSAGN